MGAVEDKIQLEKKIISNKISKKDLMSEIEAIEKKYGKDTFLPYNLTIQEKPWNKKYYNELVMLGNAGACSKEFLIHIIDVRDYLKMRARVIAGICVIAAALILGRIVVFLL